MFMQTMMLVMAACFITITAGQTTFARDIEVIPGLEDAQLVARVSPSPEVEISEQRMCCDDPTAPWFMPFRIYEYSDSVGSEYIGHEIGELKLSLLEELIEGPKLNLLELRAGVEALELGDRILGEIDEGLELNDASLGELSLAEVSLKNLSSDSLSLEAAGLVSHLSAEARAEELQLTELDGQALLTDLTQV